jgi:ribosomal protein S18 acetylase RimI-like enzyme
MRVRLAGAADVAAFRAYLQTTIGDNGLGGAYASPFSEADQRARFTIEREEEQRQAAAAPLTETSWMRLFLAEDESGRIVGHADLNGGEIPSELHRCRLGLGVVRELHRRGIGEALLRAAIAWARDAGLAWMDLGVFDGNPGAIALYRKVGFVEVGRVVDRYRVGDVPLTDIVMALRL